MNLIKKMIDFLHFAEKIKIELRNGRTSADKHESVADHSWRLALMVMIFGPSLDKEISVEKALKIALIHDLIEAITGDEPYFHHEENKLAKDKKKNQEYEAIKEIKEKLPSPLREEIFDLWIQYEEGSSYEGKFVKALDKIEAQVQHNEMDINYWNEYDFKYALTRLDKYCDFDSFLKKLRLEVQKESKEKISKFKQGG